MNDDPLARKTANRLVQNIHDGHSTVPNERPALVSKPETIEPWRIFRIMSEFVEGFDLISRYGLAASFFGSARTEPEDPNYRAANELAGRLSKQGFAIITGAAAGIMQAANKGAYEAGGASVGLNISLPNAQPYNRFLTDEFTFDHFFVRKVMLTYASQVYIYFPGGFGTLDEFFEILTLVQTKKITKVPLVLFGASYWAPLAAFFEQSLAPERRIDRDDLGLYRIVDSVDEAYEYIVANVPR